MNPDRGDVIVAADFPNAEALRAFLAQLPGVKPYLKVGMELFYATGPDLVRALSAEGYQVFLDLKLHDIPNTVAGAMRVLRGLDVAMVNLHAAGGVAMMEAAREALTRPDGSAPKLIAVTQLTSTSQEMLSTELLIDGEVDQVVAHYADLARQAGLDGVVCSPREVELVKETCGESFLTVTPGIRFAGSTGDDQVRIATPESARQSGADFIVVGRPITAAPDPLAAYEYARKEFLGL